MNTQTEEQLKDPVCGMIVEKPSDALSFEHRDRTYYFCSLHCLQKFQSNPGQYTGKKSDSQNPPATGYVQDK